MTTLKIIPDFENKTAECVGYPSAGEHVDVRIVGAANLLPSPTLRFRVKFGHVTLALFPRSDVNETWETEGADLKCHLNLNTIQARRVCCTGNTVCHAILDQVGDDEHTVEPTLFFDDLFDVTPWHREPGADEPYDLDIYPNQIADLNQRVNAIGAKVAEAKNAAETAAGSANAAYESAQSAVEAAQNANARANAAESAARGASSDASRARNDADAAVAAISRTPRIDETTNHWMVWDAIEGAFVDTGVQAKGNKGDKGDAGYSPHIGENGHWYVGTVDTGVTARGPKGDKGDRGEKGDPGSGADVLGKLPMRALPPYLHYLSFDDTYPADAAWIYAQLGPSDLGRCSAVRREGKLWRNYDWTFDDSASFAIKVSGNATRFASVGMASVGPRLTENEVMSGVYSRYYRCLPGMTLDGVNENSVVCEINVDGGPKDGWHGDADDDGIHILAAVRWALDHGETAQHAAEWIADHIIQPSGEMNFHFMVADATATYIVENGEAHDVTDGTKVLTNYALYDEAHTGGGKERYQLLAGGADISAVNFTNAYADGNDWDSDFDSQDQHAEAIRQWAEQGTDKEAHRGKTTSSGKAWWQSVYTTEYDFAAKTMKVAAQEVDDWYTFSALEANKVSLVKDSNGKFTAATIGRRDAAFAVGEQSLAAGKDVTAKGQRSFASGYGTRALGNDSHAEGDGTLASAPQSHAEGYNTTASADEAHAEGRNTTAAGEASHAGGHRANTLPDTKYGFSHGNRTIAATGAIALGYQAVSAATGEFTAPDGVVTNVSDKHKYSFVWQGKDDNEAGYYHTHGDGTFNINPIGGLAGFWIGENTMLWHILSRIAPEFAAKTGTDAYAEGAMVTYDGSLYKRNATAGADTSWVSSHWDALANLSGVLSGLDKDGKATNEFAAELVSKPGAENAINNLIDAKIGPANADLESALNGEGN